MHETECECNAWVCDAGLGRLLAQRHAVLQITGGRPAGPARAAEQRLGLPMLSAAPMSFSSATVKSMRVFEIG